MRRLVGARVIRWMSLAAAMALAAPLAAPTPAAGALSGNITVSVNFQDIRTVGAESATGSLVRSFANAFTDGTGANQAGVCGSAIVALPNATPVDLDLSGGVVVVNAYGAVTLTALKVLFVYAGGGATANTTNVLITRPATTTGVPIFAAALGGLAPLKPGGMFVLTDPSAAGISVAPASDLITFTNSAASPAASALVIVCGEP